MSLFEFWRKRKERGDILQRSRERSLSPSQLERLLGDVGIRAALGDGRLASLLPPVGTEVFRHFTATSAEGSKRHPDTEDERDQSNQEAGTNQPQRANDLEAGKPLPFFYGDPPSELLNTPLEELDPFYQSQKTFLVLGKGKTIHRFDSSPSCFLFSPLNPLRKCAIRVLIHPFVIIATILTNCVFMTMNNPPVSSYSLDFTAIYTVEVIVKVMSRGILIGRFSFVRDLWNWLDILVIILGYVSLFVDLGKVSILSSALQVLKLLPLIPGMKTTVSTLIQSGRRLVGVMVLTVLTLSILALIGQQLFMGNLRQKCFLLQSKEMDNTTRYYGNGRGGSNFNYSDILNEQVYFRPHEMDALLCGNSSDSGLCPEGFTCVMWGRNPNYGFTSFDTFGWSLLNMIRLLTQDFWENLVMMTLRAAGRVYLIVFVLIFFPGCFCLLSLIVASVAMAISEQEQAVIVEALRKEKEFIQIQEALKRNDKHEQVACRGRPSETKTGETEEKSTELEGSDGSCSPCCVLCLKWNCCGCWQWLKQRLHTLVMNPFFELIIVLCLIVNVIFMAIEHFPMTEQFEELLSIAHLVFTCIFIAELLLKVVAMDPYGYFQVGWNIFDSIIVVISLITLFTYHDHSYILLLRVFRLARWWPSFHMLLKMVWTSLRALMNLTLVLLILVFVFSVVGMQLFHEDYKDCVCRIAQDCTLPRWHMNDFFHTFLIIFRVLIGDWIETTWDCMEVSGPAMCLIFFMVVIVIGNLLVLNLFLTMVLSWFNGDSLLLSERKEKNNLDIAIDQIKKAFWTLLGKEKPEHTDDNSKDSNRKEYLALDVVTSDQPVSENQDLSGKTSKHVDTKSQSAPIAEIEDELKTTDDKEERVKRSDDDVLNHPECEQDEHNKGVKGNTPEDCCCDKCYRCCPFLDFNKSQGTGRVWSNFRRSCLSIVQHRVFEAFMIIIIVLSSAALVFEDIHLPQRPVLKIAVETADQVFTFIFLLEMLLKWSAFGLKKYFTNGWCWLDFLILNVSLTCVTTDLLGLSKPLATLWSLRALIPLRTLSRFQGLRVVIQTLVQTLPTLVNGVLVFLIVWLIYSILGVNLFAGKFWYCYNETAGEFFTEEDVDNKTQCFELMYLNFTDISWKNIKINFDSVANGYLSLLSMAMSSSWFDVMYAAVDSKQVNSQPVYEYNLYMYLYFIFFIISTFFTFIFFIRVIIDSLQTGRTGKHCFATEDQMKKIEALKIRLLSKSQKPAPRPQNPCLARLFDLVTSQWFEVFMVVVVCLNMVVLMVETWDQSFETENILHWFQFVFLIIFLMEFIMKIIPLRQHYFTSGWNILDFVVLLYLLIGLFISDLLEKYFIMPTWFSILRLVRVMRVIHLVQGGIRKLLSNFMMSLPALFNISLLLFLITFSFSIFGMFNFAYIKKEFGIDDMWNFETFWNSLTCMIMTSSTSGWIGFLLPIMDTPLDCDPFMENPGVMGIGNCGNPMKGVIFFTTYIILTSLLLVYLYIAVVMETFSLEDAGSLSDEGLQMFYNTWMKFDPDATQCIQNTELSEFCSALQGPLKIPKPNSIKLTNMELPLLPGDKIHCMDILSALRAQVFGDSGDVDALKDRLQDKFNENSPKVSSEPISSTLQGKLEEEVAMVIQHKDAEEVADGSMGGANGGSGV